MHPRLNLQFLLVIPMHLLQFHHATQTQCFNCLLLQFEIYMCTKVPHRISSKQNVNCWLHPASLVAVVKTFVLSDWGSRKHLEAATRISTTIFARYALL